jgi:hypothetical protein
MAADKMGHFAVCIIPESLPSKRQIALAGYGGNAASPAHVRFKMPARIGKKKDGWGPFPHFQQKVAPPGGGGWVRMSA